MNAPNVYSYLTLEYGFMSFTEWLVLFGKINNRKTEFLFQEHLYCSHGACSGYSILHRPSAVRGFSGATNVS